MLARAPGSLISCRLSSTRHTDAGARSNAAITAEEKPGSDNGTASVSARASRTAARSRAGLLSCSSSVSHATRSPRRRAHSASSVVLPQPAGPVITVTGADDT